MTPTSLSGFADGAFRRPLRLVLASRSPRRRRLLLDAGYRFEILPAADDAEALENADPSDPLRYVERLAFVKARDVVERLKNGAATESAEAVDSAENASVAAARAGERRNRADAERISRGSTVVVACDSVAVCAGEILGKPRDRADAERMLRLLSGSIHCVHTGLCVWAVEPDVFLKRVETSRLAMDVLSEERLASYLDGGLWKGKAGAFGYQDGNDWLRLISGSASNVVGLPLEAFAESLREIADVAEKK